MAEVRPEVESAAQQTTEGTTQKEVVVKANDTIKNMFGGDRKLDDQSQATIESREEDDAEADLNTAEVDTEGDEKQDTEVTGGAVFLQLQIDGEDIDLDLSDESAIAELHKKLEGQKLKLDDGTEYDLSNPEDIEKLRNHGIDEEEAGGNVRDLVYTKDGKPVKEKIDLSKQEDVDKLFKYASGGRLFEVERAELTKQKEVIGNQTNFLADQAQYVGYSIMNMIAGNKMTSRDFQELPYEDFIGSSEQTDKDGNVTREASPEEDKKLWNAHNQQAKKNITSLEDYKQGVEKTSKEYTSMLNDFKQKHPEIEDLDKWINEHVAPYHLPVVSYGKVAYPKDTLDMIHFWNNREQIISDARKEGKREKAKVIVRRDKQGGKISHVSTTAVDKARNAARNLAAGGKRDVQIVS